MKGYAHTNRVLGFIFIIIFLIAGIMLTGCSKRIQRDFEREKYDWLVRHNVEAYERVGRRNPQWDRVASQFLKNVCQSEANQEMALPYEALEQQARELLNSGCDDPLVAMWYGYILYRNRKSQEAEPILRGALEGIQERGYPNVHAFWAAIFLMHIADEASGKPQSQVEHWKKTSMSSMCKAIGSGEFEEGEAPIAFRLIDLAYSNIDITQFFEAIRNKKDVNPWLLKMLGGTGEIGMAWETCGGYFSYTLRVKGRERFRMHLERARSILTEAWQLHPEYPEAASQMIEVAMGGRAGPGETERLWFDRAVKAQMDYAPAYHKLLRTLLPRWGGSHKAMYDFGLECLHTKRFDTDVPLFYLIALRNIAGEFENNRWRAPFRRPGLHENLRRLFEDMPRREPVFSLIALRLIVREYWNSRSFTPFSRLSVHENLRRLFEGMLKEPVRAKDRDRILTQQALTEAWCGNYEKAKQMLDNLGVEVDLKNGFCGRGLSWGKRSREVVEAELRAFTGPHRELLRRAEYLNLAGRMAEALPLFEQAMEANKDDKGVHAYLRRRIAITRMDYWAEEVSVDWTALHLAARRNHIEVAKFILEKGAEINPKTGVGNTPLHFACSEDHEEMVRFLLENGADINARSKSNLTPLHNAIEKGHQRIVGLLIEKGADVNALTIGDWTPLHFALYYNQPDVAKVLIQKGADVNAVNYKNAAPLHFALQNNQSDIAHLLIQKGADINALNEENWTPLHIALYYKKLDVAKVLIQKGADVNALTDKNVAPLHIAIYQGQPDIAILLIQKGVDVDVSNNYQWTPLHMAAHYGYADVVKLLLERGANRNARLPDGRTPLAIAQEQKKKEVVEILSH